MWCAGRARSQGLLRIDHLVSRARLERLIEQGDVPFITQPAARASDLDQIAGHAQGIMLRRVPRYARSIGAMKAANSIVADRKRTKASQMPKIVNLALQGDGGHGAFTWGMLDRLLEEEASAFRRHRWNERRRGRRRRARRWVGGGRPRGVRDGITA